MKNIFESLPAEAQEQLKETEQPAWINPMLATLTDDYFSDEGWLFERKLDGERCLVFRNGDQIRLMSRNRKELTLKYPELAEAVGRQGPDQFILDGEIVAFEGNVTSFARLQQRMHIQDPAEARQSDVSVYCYFFDLLYLAGYDLSEVPLRRRKSVLKQAFSFEDPLRFMPHRNTDGQAFYQEACAKGWEGIIAKQADAPYVHSRSKRWLKFKCVNQQEFVIGGYTEPHGKRIGFGALLVGFYDDDQLQYAGKVGTGYDQDTLRRLKEQFESLERDNPPFVESDDLPQKEVHWLEPELVAQIGFEEWTDYGKLRQPRFQGLRDDKSPQEVVKEEPAS